MNAQEYDALWREVRAEMRESGLEELDAQFLAQLPEKLEIQNKVVAYLELLSRQIRLRTTEQHEKTLELFGEFVGTPSGEAIDGLTLRFSELDQARFEAREPAMDIQPDGAFDEMDREMQSLLRMIAMDQRMRPDEPHHKQPGTDEPNMDL